MKIEILSRYLLKHFKLHSARAKLFAHMILSTIKAGKVNLKRLAEEIFGEATLESKIRRCQRFFKDQNLDMIAGGKLIIEMLGIIGTIKIALDRTDWMFGKNNINYFVASVIIGSTAIPICWILLDKKGNSATSERILLTEILLQIIPREQIECVLGDREFIGQEWFQWIIDQKLKFIIRIKENFLVKVGGKETFLPVLFSELRQDQELYKSVLLWEIPLTIVGKRLQDGSLLILASNYVHHTQLCEAYKKRWCIEICFKNLKSNGFDLESTHMTNPEKLSKLMLILAIASAIVVKTGAIRTSEKPIRILAHDRPAFSLFTYGIDYLRSYILKVPAVLQKHLNRLFCLPLNTF